MEAWRVPSSAPGMSNTSTLFCPNCAMRVNMQGAIQVAPIQLDAFDRMNMGMHCQEFADPSIKLQMAQQPEGGEAGKVISETPAAKWNKLLGS